ncbi:hypothetical protein AEAC466_01645 [Asticcacaulis sp. AC466]|uniref:hypothetical protein n=1 Tax=Asticcacaulis sp. AC466 TaxID=1282362 RepID=UPI0003C3E445|nr:hypothetical protein [Asticcacaulis sp. AC466]ESQ85909.1 hypothetical protein AEAC466_01645 [Asticcacaulis sp. AC466]
MTLINWTPETQRAFTRENLVFTQSVADSELFSEEALITLIDRYPRDSVEVFTMGYEPTIFGEWYLGRKTASDGTELDGRALMEAVKAGRLWLNLRRVNHADPAVGALCDAIFKEVAEKTGTHNLKTDLGLLISSPNAHVVYHLDMPMVMLWQIRGVKTVYLYPADAGFFTDRQIEGIALRESDENLPYEAAFDRKALIHDLKPGEMLTWPQNAPHRIVNGDMVNVSLSIEFMTPRALWRANVIYANGLLRRLFGLNPSLASSPKILEPFKVVFARLYKMATGGFKGHKSPLKPAFSLDPARPGTIIYDDGVKPFTPPPAKKATKKAA